jgi:streptogramin lyase
MVTGMSQRTMARPASSSPSTCASTATGSTTRTTHATARRSGVARHRYGRWLAGVVVGFGVLQAVAAGTASGAPGDITEFPLPNPNSSPVRITAGPDGNLWFTEFGGNSIGRITPTGTITEFPLPDAASGPAGITAGPDGNVWFTEDAGNRIGRITPTGTITEFPLPAADRSPNNIAAGPDGNLWFAEFGGNSIGRITPTGTVAVFALPNPSSDPFDIAAGPDGNLWFTEYSGNRIGRITPTGTVTEFPLPNASVAPTGITAGPDGNLWFTESGGDRIGRITPAGTITEFTLPDPISIPSDITAGSDGNLWFTESARDRIGRISPAGTITEFPLPSSGGGPEGIAAGPDGNIWFTENIGNRIGRIEVARTAPMAELDPAAHDFGEQTVGTSSEPRRFTLSNTGTAPLVVDEASIGGANAGDFATTDDNCSGATVAVGASCTLDVTFTPTEPGPRSAALSVTDNAAGSPHTAELSGTGNPTGPGVAIDPTSHDFGDHAVGTTSDARQFTVSNTGTAPLEVEEVSIDGANAGDFAVTDDDCSGATVQPGDACTLAVTFTPGGTGTRAATLAIADNAEGSPHTAALAGTGTATTTTATTTTTPSTTPPSTPPPGGDNGGSGRLPLTGSSIGQLLAWALGLTAVGCCLLAAARRRATGQ